MTVPVPDARVPVEVVIPLRWRDPDPEAVAALAAHLEDLAMVAHGVTVVDGSPDELLTAHQRVWCGPARVIRPDAVDRLWPDRPWTGRNGKVVGAFTGVLAARSELVVIADDDVRHTRATLRALAARLEHADLVRPVNVFAGWPWHARWDGARTLLNAVFATEWPGTLAVRRSAVLAAGGWCPDVLFENLELWRTLQARGHRVVVAGDVVVPRCPPTAGHFWSQRVRQAYDDLAQPPRLLAELALLPGLFWAARRGAPTVLGGALAAVALASLGRVRLGRVAVPADVPLWAPVWGVERAVCVWLALGSRVRGGVRYGGVRMPLSAHSRRALRPRR